MDTERETARQRRKAIRDIQIALEYLAGQARRFDCGEVALFIETAALAAEDLAHGRPLRA